MMKNKNMRCLAVKSLFIILLNFGTNVFAGCPEATVSCNNDEKTIVDLKFDSSNGHCFPIENGSSQSVEVAEKFCEKKVGLNYTQMNSQSHNLIN